MRTGARLSWVDEVAPACFAILVAVMLAPFYGDLVNYLLNGVIPGRGVGDFKEEVILAEAPWGVLCIWSAALVLGPFELYRWVRNEAAAGVAERGAKSGSFT